MSIKRDEMQRAQGRRKQLLSDWKKIGSPSIYSTNDVKAHKKILGETQARFLLSCEGAVHEISLLDLTCQMLANAILDLRGFKPDSQGFYNQALVDECIDSALGAASKHMNPDERPKSSREDADGNVQMTVDDAMQEMAAEGAREGQEPIAFISQNPDNDPVDIEEDATVEAENVEVLPPSEPNNEDDCASAKAESKRSKGGRKRPQIKPKKGGGKRAS